MKLIIVKMQISPGEERRGEERRGEGQVDERNPPPPPRLRGIPASFDVNVFSVMKRSADVNSTKPTKASVSHHLFAAGPLHFSASALSTCQEKPERLSAAITLRVLNGPPSPLSREAA